MSVFIFSHVPRCNHQKWGRDPVYVYVACFDTCIVGLHEAETVLSCQPNLVMSG